MANAYQDRVSRHLKSIKGAIPASVIEPDSRPQQLDTNTSLPPSQPTSPSRNVMKGLPLPPNDLASKVRRTVR